MAHRNSFNEASAWHFFIVLRQWGSLLLIWAANTHQASCMLQGGSAQEVKAPAEGAPGPAAETPLAPYVPLMATDAVADAAAALLLDDVVPVQEENVVVVESISSNAGQSSDPPPLLSVL